MHASLEPNADKMREAPIFKKWASICDPACFETSINQIFHGLLGNYRNLFTIKALNDRIVRSNWISKPATPKIWQE